MELPALLHLARNLSQQSAGENEPIWGLIFDLLPQMPAVELLVKSIAP